LEDGAKFKGSIDMGPAGADRLGAQPPTSVPAGKLVAVEDKLNQAVGND
jgi:hypothetical protein